MIAVCLLICSASAQTAPEASVLLTFRANRGDEMTYATTMTFKESNSTIVIRGDVSQQVLEVKDGLVTMNNVLKGRSMSVDGRDGELPDAAVSKTIFRVTGEVTAIQRAKADKNDVRGAMAQSVLVPSRAVAAGETWTIELPAMPASHTRKTKATYRLAQISGEGRAKVAVVEVDYKEMDGKDPIHTMGTVSIQTSTGWVIQSNLKIKNFPLLGGKTVQLEFSRTAKTS